ncbi:hypothetical protein FLX35_05535 [Cylindrospermopsis raciborskii LB2897]|nr:hypothetical protein [Cylindrospermopsis raciborskii LB2897]
MRSPFLKTQLVAMLKSIYSCYTMINDQNIINKHQVKTRIAELMAMTVFSFLVQKLPDVHLSLT